MILVNIRNGSRSTTLELPCSELSAELIGIGVPPELTAGGTKSVSVRLFPQADDITAEEIYGRMLPDDSLLKVNELCELIESGWGVPDRLFTKAAVNQNVRGAENLLNLFFDMENQQEYEMFGLHPEMCEIHI